ncbi:hypothetical protein [Rubellicoccus peritrichatus]|uniref:Uncharacterized protein n=1 Tax=Rubellicoccus peritrichatus TaxID=3080537 RepID=A0AAQ3LBL3_9BACT|nr:hypothetical protein [Puniceicoccus sp. CR14]WOO43079.1 hypothetical protein RZN69_08230 [Puniceicoccus sp. CR14]
MKIKQLDTILESILKRTYLSDYCFASKDLDGILDRREDEGFEKEWIDSHKRIEAKFSDSNLSEETKEKIEEIRKESFLATSRATEQHEIASYVSDDFDLIAKNIALGLADPFIDSLFEKYIQDKLPEGN